MLPLSSLLTSDETPQGAISALFKTHSKLDFIHIMRQM